MNQVAGNTIDLNLAETVFIPTANTYDGSTDTVLRHDKYSNVTIHRSSTSRRHDQQMVIS
jgi:hypothetical protein